MIYHYNFCISFFMEGEKKLQGLSKVENCLLQPQRHQKAILSPTLVWILTWCNKKNHTRNQETLRLNLISSNQAEESLQRQKLKETEIQNMPKSVFHLLLPGLSTTPKVCLKASSSWKTKNDILHYLHSITKQK